METKELLNLLNDISGCDNRGDSLCDGVDSTYGDGTWKSILDAVGAIEPMRKDAGRYRYLRGLNLSEKAMAHICCLTGEKMDEEIDADIASMVRDAIQAEREACAGLCEDAIGNITETPLRDCAKAIRAR